DADPDLAERRARADAAAWAHHQRAADDTQEGDLGFALDFHLQRLNATDPPSRHQQLKRAELRSRAGEWAGAAADYRAWLGSRPTEGWEEVVARLAMAEALAGQGDAGRRLWPLPGSGPGRFHLERAALTMQAVTPSEGLHVALCLLASSQTPEVRALVGLAQVRAGHRDAARTTLLPLVRPVVPCPRAAANASLGLAMLEAAEGRSESARGLIREAERWAQSGDGLSRITNMDPGTWPVYRLLHREACRVVGGGDDRTGRRGTGGTASVR
ncbi:MAG: hypothetical protein U0840_14690, partial [Gemmataceae bacterium]